VALLATRYGSRGLGVGLLVGWGATALVALMLRVPMALVLGRTTSGADLGTLAGVVLIGWVASIHERRTAELSATVASLKERCADDHRMVGELRTAAVALRGRADRLETSLTFLRDVASRLEGTDPFAAAQAGLDLAMARTGARAGMVAVLDENGQGGLTGIASSGAWNTPDLLGDRTAAAALRNRRGTRAIDISDGGSTDSDLVAPIMAGKGDRLVGLMALRGVPQGGSSAAALHDLSLVATWCAKAVSNDLNADRTRGGARLLGGGDDAGRGGDDATVSGAPSEALQRSVSRLNI
jgi:hypothetical protein